MGTYKNEYIIKLKDVMDDIFDNYEFDKPEPQYRFIKGTNERFLTDIGIKNFANNYKTMNSKSREIYKWLICKAKDYNIHICDNCESIGT